MSDTNDVSNNAGATGVANDVGSSGGGRGRGAVPPQSRQSGIRLTIEPFTPETQKWNVHQKRLEQTFIVQDLTDDMKKKALLLTFLGSSMCNLLWDLCSPDDPTDDDISYDDICELLSRGLPEDIFSSLEGGVLFTKMDLSQAYLQLELDPPSKELSTINTPFGLYRYNRLPFGIASAPGKFQRVMDDLFRDLPWVKCYLDDILVAGRTEEEHWARLTEVLRRRLQLEKCLFAVFELPYLGFIVSKDSLKTSLDKLKAVLETKRPEYLQSLRSFLGLVNYCGKFISRLASVAAPL